MKHTLIFLFVLLFRIIGSAQTADELYKQIYDLLDRGSYKQALPVADKAAELVRMQFGSQSAPYAQSLLIQASVYHKSRPAKNAEPLYQQALEVIRSVYPDSPVHHIHYLLGLATHYTDTRQFDKAGPLLSLATAVLDKEGKGNTSLYADVLAGRGNFLFQQGSYAEAAQMYSRAIEIEKRTGGENAADYAVNTGLLGQTYTLLGDFEKAEQLLLESMAQRKKLYGEQHLQYGNAVLRLAEFYGEVKQYQKGLELFIQAIDILKRALDVDHPDYAILMVKAAGFAYDAGDPKNAEILYEYSKGLVEKAFGDQSKEYGTVLNGLALLLVKKKEYSAARPLFEQAAAISKRINGDINPDYAGSLNNLGLLCSGMGLYNESIPYYEKSLEILNILHAWNSTDYLVCLNNLAKSYVYTGHYEKAEPLFISATRQSIRNVSNVFPILSEKEKNNYLENINWMEQMNNSFLFTNQNRARELALSNFNFQLFAKSLALTDTRFMLEQSGSSNDSVITRLFNEWKSCRTFLAKQYALSPTARDAGLSTVEARTETLEKQLSRSSAAFRGQREALLISMKEVQQALRPDESVVSFVRFTLFNRDWTDSILYAAYLLRKQDTVPFFVPLCEEKQLGKYFSFGTGEPTIRAIYRSDPLDEQDKTSISGDSLFSLVWKPLMPLLKGIHTVSYSPAGLFYKIAFHALPAGDSLLLMDRFELNQLTSIRQLALSDNQSERSPSIALFGDCDYTADTISLAVGRKQGVVAEVIENRGGWKKLEAAANEINGIRALFQAKQLNSNIYSQRQSTEEQFKEMSGHSPPIIHLATHGFYLPDPQQRREQGLAEDLRNAFTQARDPLIRSGIVLSGANWVWSGQAPIKGREDGIVTAYEIAQLDFRQTDLVVLSACQTALGDIVGSEGVFGLQRAFKLAGVHQLILSLWKVPDKETAELMNLFYANYLKGKTVRESFLAAQQDMRSKYVPFYWAAFVLVE